MIEQTEACPIQELDPVPVGLIWIYKESIDPVAVVRITPLATTA